MQVRERNKKNWGGGGVNVKRTLKCRERGNQKGERPAHQIQFSGVVMGGQEMYL